MPTEYSTEIISSMTAITPAFLIVGPILCPDLFKPMILINAIIPNSIRGGPIRYTAITSPHPVSGSPLSRPARISPIKSPIKQSPR